MYIAAVIVESVKPCIEIVLCILFKLALWPWPPFNVSGFWLWQTYILLYPSIPAELSSCWFSITFFFSISKQDEAILLSCICHTHKWASMYMRHHYLFKTKWHSYKPWKWVPHQRHLQSNWSKMLRNKGVVYLSFHPSKSDIKAHGILYAESLVFCVDNIQNVFSWSCYSAFVD